MIVICSVQDGELVEFRQDSWFWVPMTGKRRVGRLPKPGRAGRAGFSVSLAARADRDLLLPRREDSWNFPDLRNQCATYKLMPGEVREVRLGYTIGPQT